ncbi:histidine phosphatase family protein [Tundrisphaera lichenicola]|uniref:histidine phosphatase family protein n=1 Tax=Tundrisphaera lichenicola TaxID=2029860 RepID=UPI003EB81959
MSHDALPEVYLARHGETAWALSGQHTGLTDIPLTERGERNARSLGERLKGLSFTEVWTSPLHRASRTCELAGFEGQAKVNPDLVEWDYGDYEGRKTVDIRQENPDWFLFRDGVPNGESVQAIGARADRVIDHLRGIEGNVLLFGHGHFFRVLAARWLDLVAGDARLFLLGTASLSILGYEHNPEEPVIKLWNDNRHLTD